MKVNDLRNKKQELSFDDLNCGFVYISSRLQKYLLMTEDDTMVCLESGSVFHDHQFNGDVFEPVSAVLEIK